MQRILKGVFIDRLPHKFIRQQVLCIVASQEKLRQNVFMNFPWPVVLYIYGVLLIVGGLIGYVKAKSVPSAVAGLICGFIALFLGYRYARHPAPYVALVLALALIFLMGRRYLNTRKPMPALPIVILSIIVAIAQICVILFVGLGNEPL